MAVGNENNLEGKVVLNVRDFKSGVSDLSRQIRVIESGFKAASAGTEDWTKDAGALGQRIDSLSKVIELQKKKVEAAAKAHQNATKEYGASSKAAQNLEMQLNKEKKTLGE